MTNLNMTGERWLMGWRSRRVLLWTAAIFLIFLVSGPLSAKGQCERWAYPDGTWLPIGYPWHPTTTEGRVATQRFIFAMGFVNDVSERLGLILLVGLLWARAVRVAGLVGALVSIPVLALVSVIPEYVITLAPLSDGPEPPRIVQLAWDVAFMGQPLSRVSRWLVWLGVAALGIRAAVHAARSSR